MKVRILSVLILCGIFSDVIAEDQQDSTHISVFRQRTDRVLSEVFRPEPELNNPDSIIKVMDDLPPFGIYKDNYFVAGTDMFKKPTSSNSDAKFQVSIRHILTNSVLPFKTYLFLTYTQVAFWDIFKESFPFRDLNFNPTIGLGKHLVRKNRYLGGIMFQLEHESNGKDGENSRSWNKLSGSLNLVLHRSWVMQAKIWVPIIDGENNRDLVKYKGYMHIASSYQYKDFNFSAMLIKRGGANLNHNIMLSIAYKLFKNTNQYLFVDYYNGYGESLLDYNEYRQRLRIGFIIKSPLSSMF